MKTSDPQENFLTVMRNGKFGIFRIESSSHYLKELLEICSDVGDIEEDAPFIYLSNLTLKFDDEEMDRLSEVRVKLIDCKQMSWYKTARLDWLTWISETPFSILKDLLKDSGLPFKAVVYSDQTLGLISTRGSSSVSLLFDESGLLLYVINTFGYGPFGEINELLTFNTNKQDYPVIDYDLYRQGG